MLKDERLAHLAKQNNVARFVSFAPTGDLSRYHALDDSGSIEPIQLSEAVRILLSRAESVNVRTFADSDSKSTDFVYGLTNAQDVESSVLKFSNSGLYTIINETLDINDGGVSGVSIGDVTEFAPGATPRIVEQAGDKFARLPAKLASKILTTVYGFRVDTVPPEHTRLEFSVHPKRVGQRQEHTIVWEVSDTPSEGLEVKPAWPNSFSRFLGDKIYGLVIADAYGLPVPRATAFGRRFAPFAFGIETGSSEVWLRTSPASATPGHFTTVKGWRDPFVMLEEEDPQREVAGVLAQEGVAANHSGGAASQVGKRPLVEGVSGYGDEFMLGQKEPVLPARVRRNVEDLVRKAEHYFGPVQLEWAADKRTAWLLQIHQRSISSVGGGVLSPGNADTWIDFDPLTGLDELRVVIRRAKALEAGIRVTRPVGITSHVGDILRSASVPGRLA